MSTRDSGAWWCSARRVARRASCDSVGWAAGVERPWVRRLPLELRLPWGVLGPREREPLAREAAMRRGDEGLARAA